jgi:hypothetical protein
VAGTAIAVVEGMQHHAAEKAQTQADGEACQLMQQQAAMEQAARQAAAEQAAAAPAAAPAADTTNQLEELAALKAQGVLTEGEFAAQKARILGG